MTTLHILMVQMNTLVGDFDGNTRRVIDIVKRAEAVHPAPVVVFPELTLSGYPPEDLLLRPSIELRVRQSLELLCAELTGEAYAVIGYPKREGEALYNVAGVVHRGEFPDGPGHDRASRGLRGGAFEPRVAAARSFSSALARAERTGDPTREG